MMTKEFINLSSQIFPTVKTLSLLFPLSNCIKSHKIFNLLDCESHPKNKPQKKKKILFHE